MDKSLFTDHTGIRFFPCVYFHVSLKRVDLCESFFAMLTPVGFFSAVCQLMPLKTRVVVEPFPTMGALIYHDTFMDLLMSL